MNHQALYMDYDVHVAVIQNTWRGVGKGGGGGGQGQAWNFKDTLRSCCCQPRCSNNDLNVGTLLLFYSDCAARARFCAAVHERSMNESRTVVHGGPVGGSAPDAGAPSFSSFSYITRYLGQEVLGLVLGCGRSARGRARGSAAS